MDLHDIGPRLAAMRRARGLTQAEVAERLGTLWQSRVSMLEAGAATAQASSIDAYLRAIGAGWEELVHGAYAAPVAESEEYDYDALGPALRALRDSAGKQQKELAVAAGVVARQLGLIEQGKAGPQWRTLAAILQATGADLIALAWLLWRGSRERFLDLVEAAVRRPRLPPRE